MKNLINPKNFPSWLRIFQRPMLFLSLLIHGLVLNIPLPPQPELQTEEIIENVEIAEIPPLPKPSPSPSPSKKPDKPKPTPSGSATVSRSRPQPPPLQSSPQRNISDNTLTKKPFPEDDDDEVIKNDDPKEQEVEDDDDGQGIPSNDEDDGDDNNEEEDEELDPVQFLSEFTHPTGATDCGSGKPQCKQISGKSRRVVVEDLKNNQGYELEEQTDLRQYSDPNDPSRWTIFQVFKVIKEDGKELYLNVYAPSDDRDDPMEYRFSEEPLTIAEFQEP